MNFLYLVFHGIRMYFCPDTGLHSRLFPFYTLHRYRFTSINSIIPIYSTFSLSFLLISAKNVKLFSLLELFMFLLHKLSLFECFFFFCPSPFPPDCMPSYDEKSDPFLFQSLFSLLISVFVVLTDSVSLYAFWCIPHALHGKWYKFNPCCFWII